MQLLSNEVQYFTNLAAEKESVYQPGVTLFGAIFCYIHMTSHTVCSDLVFLPSWGLWPLFVFTMKTCAEMTTSAHPNQKSHMNNPYAWLTTASTKKNYQHKPSAQKLTLHSFKLFMIKWEDKSCYCWQKLQDIPWHHAANTRWRTHTIILIIMVPKPQIGYIFELKIT